MSIQIKISGKIFFPHIYRTSNIKKQKKLSMKLLQNINPMVANTVNACPNHIWAVVGHIMPIIDGNYNDYIYGSGFQEGVGL